MKKVVVSASSLPAGRNMSSQLEYVERVGNYGADMYHIDVMDGEFVKYKSVDFSYLEQLKEHTTMPFDVHLMIKNPQRVIDKYIRAGANIISIHQEVVTDTDQMIDLLKKIKRKGVMAGVAIDIDTDIALIKPFLEYIDVALIMSVKVGKYGQAFDDRAIKKIKYVRNQNKTILIEVDGGINDKTVTDVVKAGADIVVSGSYIYNNDAYQAIQTLKGKNG